MLAAVSRPLAVSKQMPTGTALAANIEMKGRPEINDWARWSSADLVVSVHCTLGQFSMLAKMWTHSERRKHLREQRAVAERTSEREREGERAREKTIHHLF